MIKAVLLSLSYLGRLAVTRLTESASERAVRITKRNANWNLVGHGLEHAER
ncbi:MAG TPA: hypothetical protein VLI05_03895 [Candidatus Saccharimonadia bacterium]|nr:hypothetical protein [Candidatus Saccharimonadia bacterium]